MVKSNLDHLFAWTFRRPEAGDAGDTPPSSDDRHVGDDVEIEPLGVASLAPPYPASRCVVARRIHRCFPRPWWLRLAMVVRDECSKRPSQVILAEQDQAIEALGLDRSDEPFRGSDGVGPLNRGLHNAYPRRVQLLANRRAPFSVAIADQHPVADTNERTLVLRARIPAHGIVRRRRVL